MILETINSSSLNIQTFLIGSAAEYGNIDREINEEDKLAPLSVYGLSKKIQFEICEFYREKFGMKINYLRPFNISGNTSNRNLLIGEINYQIQINKQNNTKKFSFGDLGGFRDYLSIQEFVKIIEKLIKIKIENHTLNIASGKGIEVREFVKQTIKESGITNPEIIEEKIISNKSYKSVIADITKVKENIRRTMNSFKIGKCEISEDSGVVVIAEAAVEHLGSLNAAKRMADAAKESGADIIKYQIHLPEFEMLSGK